MVGIWFTSRLERGKYGRKNPDERGRLIVPDCPVIPYIEGDGIGRDIWSVSQKLLMLQ